MSIDEAAQSPADPRAALASRDWLGEAQAALNATDYQHAIYAAREALTLDGTLHEAWSIRSQASFGLEQPQDAVFEAREAIRLAPQVAAYHHQLGDALEVLKRYDEALRELQEAVRLDPANLRFRGSIGSVYLGQKRPAEAVQVFRDLLPEASTPDERDFCSYFFARALYEDAVTRTTSMDGGEAYAITSLDMARFARSQADRALGLSFTDDGDLRASLR